MSTNINAKRDRRLLELNQLIEDIYWTEESYGEHVTQYRSECALFGDAGPGQGRNLILMTARLGALRARAKVLQSKVEGVPIVELADRAAAPFDNTFDDDIPF